MAIRTPKAIGEDLTPRIEHDARSTSSKLGKQLNVIAAELRAALLGVKIDVSANTGRISFDELEAAGLALRRFGDTYVFVRPKANSGFPVDLYHGKRHEGPAFVMPDGTSRVVSLNGTRIRIEVQEDAIALQEESG